MPLDFPSSPVNGQVYQNYVWSSTDGVWRAQGSTNNVGDTVDGLTFINDGVKPVTQAEVDAASPQLEYEYNVNVVKQERHAAYIAPDGSDALLAKFQLGEDGVTLEMVQARKSEINEQYPYPVKEENA